MLCEVLHVKRFSMKIQAGYELVFECPQPTPMILLLNIHHSRASDIIIPDLMSCDPPIPVRHFHDGFGNWCSRVVAPQGRIRIRATGIVQDHGEPDEIAPAAAQQIVEELPDETLVYLLGSRYCETDRLSQAAWDLFGQFEMGWRRVQAICDFVHRHIAFGYEYADSSKTAEQVFQEGRGVCRDFAHLAISFCRCMNIPARYCTGYLGDIGIPPPYGPMDFAGWFEAYLDGRWYTFDPRNNIPRIGRILIARGRDATDVAISTSFGPSKLVSFKVYTDEIAG
jgi:transglutaminase-like putative cysteine protease